MPKNFTYGQIEKLREAMCYLSHKQRSVIYMRFWDNMTINEISRHVGLSWKSTDQLIDSAVNHLRVRLLNPELVGEDDLVAQVLRIPLAAIA